MSGVRADDFLRPDWPAPPGVRALITTRHGGVSAAPYASFNLGSHVGDDPARVGANRARLASLLPAAPCWLEQVHGADVIDLGALPSASMDCPPRADGALTRRTGVVCAVLTADCLPVLLCDAAGSVVAAAHAGWRGLLAGVLERTVAAMAVPAGGLMAYLGPAIGPESFEVGDEVRAAFVAAGEEAEAAFKPLRPGKWLANIYLLAHQRLARSGVDAVHGGGFCTVHEAERYFSYRRDGTTGRMASLIWLAD